MNTTSTEASDRRWTSDCTTVKEAGVNKTTMGRPVVCRDSSPLVSCGLPVSFFDNKEVHGSVLTTSECGEKPVNGCHRDNGWVDNGGTLHDG